MYYPTTKYKIYILTFDQEEVDYKNLHEIIKLLYEQKVIINYWHYIRTSYILVSDNNADELARLIGEELNGDKIFFLTEVNLSNSQGWLTKEAWAWINRQKEKYHL